ncbi:MAG: hypothetical protein GY928_08590 [Colwellia sp.]|nr:hypothetical protein [Colwellia sp.]
MIGNSEKKLKDIEVGQSVRISIPDVDRAPIDSRNIIGIVIKKSENNFF